MYAIKEIALKPASQWIVPLWRIERGLTIELQYCDGLERSLISRQDTRFDRREAPRMGGWGLPLIQLNALKPKQEGLERQLT
jgi:hypothetical protein